MQLAVIALLLLLAGGGLKGGARPSEGLGGLGNLGDLGGLGGLGDLGNFGGFGSSDGLGGADDGTADIIRQAEMLEQVLSAFGAAGGGKKSSGGVGLAPVKNIAPAEVNSALSNYFA